MKVRWLLLLAVSHAGIGVAGFALGIYLLPILIAPPAPSDAAVVAAQGDAMFAAEFRRDLAGSDALHWGEGRVYVNHDAVSFMGELAPGPDYKLYLSPAFVETEEAFNTLKPQMLRIGDVKTFRNFIVTMPEDVDPAAFNTVVVWCETFGEFITAAQYRP